MAIIRPEFATTSDDLRQKLRTPSALTATHPTHRNMALNSAVTRLLLATPEDAKFRHNNQLAHCGRQTQTILHDQLTYEHIDRATIMIAL